MSAETSKPADFEKALSSLESIVEKLESGELSLDDSVMQYEQGMALIKQCQSALEKARKRIDILDTASPADKATTSE